MATTYRVGTIIPLFFLRIRGDTLVEGLSVTVRVLNAKTGAVLLADTPLSEVTPGLYSYSWDSGISQFTQCVEIYTVGGQEFGNQFTIDTPSIMNIVQIEADAVATNIETDAFIDPTIEAVVISVSKSEIEADTEMSQISVDASSIEAQTEVEPDVTETIKIDC